MSELEQAAGRVGGTTRSSPPRAWTSRLRIEKQPQADEVQEGDPDEIEADGHDPWLQDPGGSLRAAARWRNRAPRAPPGATRWSRSYCQRRAGTAAVKRPASAKSAEIQVPAQLKRTDHGHLGRVSLVRPASRRSRRGRCCRERRRRACRSGWPGRASFHPGVELLHAVAVLVVHGVEADRAWIVAVKSGRRADRSAGAGSAGAWRQGCRLNRIVARARGLRLRGGALPPWGDATARDRAAARAEARLWTPAGLWTTVGWGVSRWWRSGACGPPPEPVRPAPRRRAPAVSARRAQHPDDGADEPQREGHGRHAPLQKPDKQARRRRRTPRRPTSAGRAPAGRSASSRRPAPRRRSAR